MKLTYSGVLGMGMFTCDVNNKADGIEISNYDGEKYTFAKLVIERLLRDFVRPYSKLDTTTNEGKAKLAKELEEDIKKLELEIEQRKLAIKMCKRKKVYFKK